MMAKALSNELGFEVSSYQLKRFLKKLGYSWKRFRKSLKKKQNEQQYAEKYVQLKALIQLYRSGFIDLRFADESGFNMEGYIPYGWQPKGTYLHITPSKTKGRQVFGLMNLDNQLQAYSCQGSINSDIVIAFIDDFCKTIKQRTVIILDNASIHCSKAFLKKQQEWKAQDLYIFHLPKYSPHLNPIEILWRKIKYEWLQYEFIDNQDQLNEELERILNAFGTEYNINFKNQKVSNIFT